MTTLMETHCISFREIPQTTKLFATFLEDFGRVARYYGHLPSIAGVTAAAKEVRLDPEVRRGVVEVLREQNMRFGGTAELDPEIGAKSGAPGEWRGGDCHRPAGGAFHGACL